MRIVNFKKNRAMNEYLIKYIYNKLSFFNMIQYKL